MTNRLREIEARLAAASPGPWEAVHQSPVEHEVVGPTPNDTGGVLIAADTSRTNSELIAHAPEDLSALVEFAREIQALANDWTFTGKGEPDDMPDEFELTRDECAYMLRKRLNALNEENL